MTRRTTARLLVLILAVIIFAGFASRRPGVSHRMHLVQRKLSGDLAGVSWMELGIRMAPDSWHAALREKLLANAPHWWKKLDFPAEGTVPWRMHGVFDGPTVCLAKLDCHVSVLQAGMTPHDLHQHSEEEIIMPLSGAVDILTAPDVNSSSPHVETLERGQFVYHAPQRPHTIRGAGTAAASYLVLRWRGRPGPGREPALPSSVFALGSVSSPAGQPVRPFSTKLLFESPTPHLAKLHCHLSVMQPGAGYAPHADNHDVIIVVLDGMVETLDQQIGADSVVFYAANRPHGMKNPGTVPARYLVFEFHSHATPGH